MAEEGISRTESPRSISGFTTAPFVLLKAFYLRIGPEIFNSPSGIRPLLSADIPIGSWDCCQKELNRNITRGKVVFFIIGNRRV